MQTFAFCYPNYNAFPAALSIDMLAISQEFFYEYSQLLVEFHKFLWAFFSVLLVKNFGFPAFDEHVFVTCRPFRGGPAALSAGDPGISRRGTAAPPCFCKAPVRACFISRNMLDVPEFFRQTKAV